MMIHTIAPILDLETKEPTGRYRAVHYSDEESNPIIYPDCDCPDGHESAEAAKDCEKVQKRYLKKFPPIGFGPIQPSHEEIDRYHFDYIRPDDRTQVYIGNARRDYKDLLTQLHSIPPSRERSIAITKLEESLTFATKAIVVAYKNGEQGKS